MAVLVIWVRVAWPRLREDQLQRLAWLWLVPLALLQLMLTGVGVVLGWSSRSGRSGSPASSRGWPTTARTALRPTHTAEYPDVAPDLPPRSRGVIALLEENCTSCMLCARECPDWCIYIDSHKETIPATTEGGRERQRNVLDRFAIDFSLCMYCGICIEVCPFDALHWSPQFEYAEVDILDLLHEKDRLGEWMATVPAAARARREVGRAGRDRRGQQAGPWHRAGRRCRAGCGRSRGTRRPDAAHGASAPRRCRPARGAQRPPTCRPGPAETPGRPGHCPRPTEAARGVPTDAAAHRAAPARRAKEPLTGTPESVPDDTSPTPPPADDAT